MALEIQAIDKTSQQITFCSVCYKTKNELQPNRTLMKCGRCKERVYCSSKCQKKDWAQHKITCKYPQEKLRQERLQQAELREKLINEINEIAIKANSDEITHLQTIEFLFKTHAQGQENELLYVLINNFDDETRQTFESHVIQSWRKLNREDIKNLIIKYNGKEIPHLCHMCKLFQKSQYLAKNIPNMTFSKKKLIVLEQIFEDDEKKEDFQKLYEILLLFAFKNCHWADITFIINILGLELFKQAFNNLKLFNLKFNEQIDLDYEGLSYFLSRLTPKLHTFILEQNNFRTIFQKRINEHLNNLDSKFIFNAKVFKMLTTLHLPSSTNHNNKKLIRLMQKIKQMKIPKFSQVQKYINAFFPIIQKQICSSTTNIISNEEVKEKNYYLKIVNERIDRLTKNNLADYICSNIECAEFLKFLIHKESSFQINLVTSIVEELYEYVTQEAIKSHNKFNLTLEKYKLYLLMRLAQVMPFPGAQLFRRWSHPLFQEMNYFDTECTNLKLPDKITIIHGFKKHLTPSKIFHIASENVGKRQKDTITTQICIIEKIKQFEFILLI